jgi:4-hydroxy-3-polyprenylbenzoate decarboxylase
MRFASERPVRITVAITGATGAIFGIRALERLSAMDVETHLIVSNWGRRTIEHETDYSMRDVQALAGHVHAVTNQASLLSSGSFRVDGMIIAPCSVRTVAGIATGLADNLITRAADVVLKERHRLVLVVRESPLSETHLENLLKLSRMGVSVFPPVPAFYNHPKSVGDLVDQIVVRALDQLGLEPPDAERWIGRLGPAQQGGLDGSASSDEDGSA